MNDTAKQLADPSLVLDVQHVGKRFGHTVALHDVSLTVSRGEVHALLGHNGSGKSTMVKVIGGVIEPDSGSVRFEGHGGNPPLVGVVHQDLGLCFDATVLENCCMAQYQSPWFFPVNWAAERRLVEPILDSLNAGFSSDALVRDLSPANQTVVAIARALKRSSSGVLDLLVLDEATARLRGRDADKVLETAQLVAKQGGGVLLVTHHMREVLQAADRATVLMNGRVAGVVAVAHSTQESLLELVSGRKLIKSEVKDVLLSMPAAKKETALRVRNIKGARLLCGREICVAEGEIVGLTGAPGAGHEEIPYMIAGVSQSASAEVSVQEGGVGRVGARSIRRGVGLVPADRLSQGIMLEASVRENLSPQVRAGHTRFRLLSRLREVSWASKVCQLFQITGVPQPDIPIATLSGGNQQKVLLARVLEDCPKVLVLHEPTEGVDEMTRRDLVQLVRKAASAGAAVVYVSSDIDEVAECSDRVLVMRDGDIVSEFTKSPDAADNIYAASYLS